MSNATIAVLCDVFPKSILIIILGVMISFQNTLTGKVEQFVPLKDGEVKMYHCGPTVYDFVHIGNLRSFILADLTRKYFEYTGINVTQVMNITDIGHLSGDGDDGEDKMTKALKREGKPLTMEAMQELADFYTERFKEDIQKLNISLPHHLPKASKHIQEDIELIRSLEEKGFVYKTSDGLYFDTSKDPHYGKLGGIGGTTESRIGTNSEKKNQRDFSLWKFNNELGYEAPWGHGFPGWHIECSAMSQKYLGKTFDIHTGGIDLAPIHHNNEIAQSENACGCEFARVWLHNEFVILDGSKMAKSDGNIIKLKGIVEKGFSPLAYRYFLLQSHYRTPTNFSWEALEAAQSAYTRIRNGISMIKGTGNINTEYKREFIDALENDLNTAQALAVVWKLLDDKNISHADMKATILDFDKVLGLDLNTPEEIPEDVLQIFEKQKQARKNKNFEESDKLRDELKQLGWSVQNGDTDETSFIFRT